MRLIWVSSFYRICFWATGAVVRLHPFAFVSMIYTSIIGWILGNIR